MHPPSDENEDEDASDESESKDPYDSMKSPERSPTRRSNTDEELEMKSKQRDVVIVLQDFICAGALP